MVKKKKKCYHSLSDEVLITKTLNVYKTESSFFKTFCVFIIIPVLISINLAHIDVYLKKSKTELKPINK